MIVWSTLETSCPICRHRLRVREVGGGFPTGQDSDLLIRMGSKHVIQAEVHSCHHCGWSGRAEDFTGADLDEERIRVFCDEVRPWLREEPPPGRQRYARTDVAGRAGKATSPETARGVPLSRTPLPHIQHHWSALCAPLLGFGAGEVGRRWLRAYWCLRLPPSCDLQEPRLRRLRRAYLKEAIACLRQGLRHESQRVVVYLVGELCRRNANFGLAVQYFERFLHRERGPLYLRQAARKLLVAAREEDARARSMEEVLYEQDPTRDRRVE